MDLQTIGRIVSFIIGGAALLILEFALGYPPYVGIPAGILAYSASRLVFALIGAKQTGKE